MKIKWSIGLALCISLSVAHGAVSSRDVLWYEDYQSALNVAVQEDRILMLYFTGSDWCTWAQRLDQQILLRPAFSEYIDKYLVPVVVDFPKYKKMSASQRQHNESLKDRFRVESFPMLVFVDSNGRVLHREGYYDVPSMVYVEALRQKLLEMDPITLKRRDERLQSGKPKPRPAPDLMAREAPALFGGATTAPPPRYTNLVLKSISGAGDRKFALLNNQTLGVGETASVKLEDRNVRIRCTEIRERSVVVKVEGETESREVRLAGPE